MTPDELLSSEVPLAGDDELLAAASEDFGLYVSLMYPSFQLWYHHREIIDALEDVEAGRCDRLAIFMPPRHGKSLLASEHFPAWCLGRRPDRQIIAMTYAKELANDFGRSVRNQVADPLYQLIFPEVSLSKDSKASNRFNTPQRGAYFAGGRNSPMTGRGAHIFLVDDPIKNMEEADSEVIRRKVVATYESVVLTRLMDQGAVVLIQTRWHEDDLAGYVLKNHKHDKWRVLELPAISPQGTALWEPRFPLSVLKRRRASMSNRAWSALYQQRPTSEEGAILLRRYWQKWTAPVPERPALVLISLDTAYTEDDDNDPSACTVWHVVEQNYVPPPLKRGEKPPPPDMRVKLLLRYAWRERLEFPALVEKIVDTVDFFGISGVTCRVLVENKANGLSVIQELRRRMPGLGLHVAPANKGKVARAHSVTAMMEAGRVYALADIQREGEDDDAAEVAVFRPWATMTIDECAAFPVGAHDDLVDSVTHALRHLRDMGVELFAEDEPAPAPATEREPLY